MNLELFIDGRRISYILIETLCSDSNEYYIRTLAKKLNITQGNVSVALKLLINYGLVEKYSKDGGKGNRHYMKSTKKGKMLVDLFSSLKEKMNA